MAQRARGINPTLDVRSFERGVRPDTVDAFLDGVDLYVDGLDFFAHDARRLVFARCRALGIPAVTAAPLGMGVAYLLFTPAGMSFDDYFRLEGLTPAQQAARFAVGLAPAALMRSYLVDSSQVDLAAQRGPSTAMACQLCAGVAGTQALKLLLRRGPIRPAPWYHHFDAYRGRWVSRRRGPVQRLRGWLIERTLTRQAPTSQRVQRRPDPLERILDAARWAPSGDNAQPWRFQVRGPDCVRIELREAADDVYDLRSIPTLIAGGCLLEALRLAASREGRGLEVTQVGTVGARHTIDVLFPRDGTGEDGLVDALPVRATDRRCYALAPIAAGARRELEQDVAPLLTVRWHQTWRERLRLAQLNMAATDLRLRCPDARVVHRRVLDWEDPLSPHGVPGAALGFGPLSRRVARWLLATDRRCQLVERAPLSTALAQLQLDLLPGLRCAAHCSFHLAGSDPLTATTLLEVGQRVQRFWLRATELGLSLQPTMAPLIFSRYAREGRRLGSDPVSARRAERLRVRFDQVFCRPEQVVFVARIGRPRGQLPARSGRRALSDLLLEPPARSTSDHSLLVSA